MQPLGDLTSRQKEIMDFIVRYIRLFLHSPTLREIGTEFGIASSNGVHDHIRYIRKKGWLLRRSVKARNIVLTRSARKYYGLEFKEQEY